MAKESHYIVDLDDNEQIRAIPKNGNTIIHSKVKGV